MFDCSKDILAYHDDEVTLPHAERTNMRGRRDANRDRLKKGLKDKGKPAPREFASQGSYAMKTMVQHPDNDYDIDDGVYFDKAVLAGERGAEMTALQTRQMVRDALDDGSFKTPPEALKNCVRVYYTAGYCVDVPLTAASRRRIFLEMKSITTNWRAVTGSGPTPATCRNGSRTRTRVRAPIRPTGGSSGVWFAKLRNTHAAARAGPTKSSAVSGSPNS